MGYWGERPEGLQRMKGWRRWLRSGGKRHGSASWREEWKMEVEGARRGLRRLRGRRGVLGEGRGKEGLVSCLCDQSRRRGWRW